MSYDEVSFLGLVGQLREKQREYFRTRSRDVLVECKVLEKKVDDIVDRFYARFTNAQSAAAK